MTDLHDIAADWQLRLETGPLDAAAEAELDRWLASDVRHRLALADAGAAWFGAANALGAATAHAAPRARRMPAWLAWAGGAAAVPLALALLFAAPGWLQRVRSDHYTSAGETREIALEDGSRVTLDADSAIALEYSPARRGVRVLAGAAHFDVQPDTARPFVVTGAGVTAVALGTAYAVELAPDGVVVAVDHGTVGVGRDGDARHATLVAGQGVRVGANGPVPLADSVDSHVAFRRGVIAFDATPLGDVLARLDRHLPGRVVVMIDDGERGRRVTAVFPLGEAQVALDAVARTHGLDVQRLPGLYIVR